MNFVNKVGFLVLAPLVVLLAASTANAGCDPCICGNGGDNPPPTGCCYGPYKDHNCSSQLELDTVAESLGQRSIQDKLDEKGGLLNVSTELSGNEMTCTFTSGDRSLIVLKVTN
jgi:hypothetical protein